MHELVAQHVQPIKDDAKHDSGLAAENGRQRAFATCRKLPFPLFAGIVLAQGNPERLEHELVVDEGADRPGELFEKRLMQTAPGIELHQRSREGAKAFTLVFVAAELARIRCVQGHPLEDEAGIGIR